MAVLFAVLATAHPVLAAASNTLTSRDGADRLKAQVAELVAQMHKCWTLPASKAGLTVNIRVDLDPKGNVEGTPQILDDGLSQDARQIAAKAVKAVKNCEPYKFDPAEYDTWKQVDITLETSN